MSYTSLAGLFSPSQSVRSRRGFHAGLTSAYNFAELRGASTALDGSVTCYFETEAPNQNIKALSFGIQAGYDYQLSNRIVAGFAADILKSEVSGSQVTFANEGSTGNNSSNMFYDRALRRYRGAESTGLLLCAAVSAVRSTIA